ncbi:D-beta-hydroxybutyrate dehydrogenase, mitochondrial [Rhipicephalus sanguineus]|uniref:D-beta-hydroxybutyrate dehydrogenase, mitochondrial n=1 Tax=Rhipicephalus sanguineus TaxID=34632 RepID=UPI0020C3271C|nr:D-beta-hydroxybutyrate dehydrogenase, mitochondrial [Rhipicephalus sanguineus]
MKTRWILFFALIFPVWQFWNRLPLLLELGSYFGSGFLVLLISFGTAKFLSAKFFRKLVDGDGKAVLITGCDTGFGNLLARRLSRDGFLVYAGCLNASSEDACELAKEPNIHVLQLDVTKDQEVDSALDAVKSSLGDKKLWAVVANAGVASHGLLEWASMPYIKRIFDVNVFGVVSVSKKCLPLLRKSKGRLVITGSVLDVGSMEMTRKQLSILPRENLDDFSEKEITDWMKAATMIADLTRRDDINEVVDQMVLAVREAEPKPNYAAWGLWEPVFYLVCREAPAELVDFLLVVFRKANRAGLLDGTWRLARLWT